MLSVSAADTRHVAVRATGEQSATASGQLIHLCIEDTRLESAHRRAASAGLIHDLVDAHAGSYARFERRPQLGLTPWLDPLFEQQLVRLVQAHTHLRSLRHARSHKVVSG